jgi:hypothetical protein
MTILFDISFSLSLLKVKAISLFKKQVSAFVSTVVLTAVEIYNKIFFLLRLEDPQSLQYFTARTLVCSVGIVCRLQHFNKQLKY